MRSAHVLAAMLALAAADAAVAAREPVLKQIDLPHSYYYREMYLPQLTSGPSSFDFSPDGQAVVYSMAGSLWRQQIGEDNAGELTQGPGYDYQPDWSPDGRRIVFARHYANAIELWQLDLTTMKSIQLTQGGAVNLQPRFSPDGRQLAYVSTAGSGHFNLVVADFESSRLAACRAEARPATDADNGCIGRRSGFSPTLGAARAVVRPRESAISRYYYSTHDHAIDPSWTPDGQRLVFVTNREVAYGTGNLCSVALGNPDDLKCFLQEETSWQAQPEVAPDGKRVLYSSYQGRQWHQLWLTTLAGDAALPLTFGEFDATQARWSPDGRRVGYISNQDGDVALWVREVVGGERTRIEARQRQYIRSNRPVRIRVSDARGQAVAARVSVVRQQDRAYGPDNAWLYADDGFDPAVQREETHYFHCSGECTVSLPDGKAEITVWRGQEYAPVRRSVLVQHDGENAVAVTLDALKLPAWAPAAVTADMHVHMNYGGHYLSTLKTLAEQARAEDLDVIYNTIVNKEQRIPDIALLGAKPYKDAGVTIIQAQEYHTSFWGHLGLLHMDDHFLTPAFSAYQHSALTSPYPNNAVIADLAHKQNGIVGYVHPYDWPIVPAQEKSLTHTLPADVALGKADYVEVVGFADHKATAAVWHKLLNLGFRLPTGSGTDAMANYASLRGPVGMNRAYLHTNGSTEESALRDALKNGRTVASNGPQLSLQVNERNIGDTLTLPDGQHRLKYRAALRSIAPIDHLELLHNGRVVASHRFGKDRTHADIEGAITVRESGWILLRAWSEGADPLIFDLYPYATTSPIYVDVGGKPARSPADAAYFVAWMDRVIAAADARADYNDEREKQETLEYLRRAREVYVGKL